MTEESRSEDNKGTLRSAITERTTVTLTVLFSVLGAAMILFQGFMSQSREFAALKASVELSREIQRRNSDRIDKLAEIIDAARQSMITRDEMRHAVEAAVSSAVLRVVQEQKKAN